MLITTMLPIGSAIESDGETDLSQVMDNEDFRRNLYNRSGYQNLVKEILPDILHRGYLD